MARINHQKRPRAGDTRQRSGFVFWKRIGDQTRILEWARWEERYLVRLKGRSWWEPTTWLTP